MRTAAVVVFLGALTVAATYPLANLAAPMLPQSDDAFFSVWRLGWVAHQLRADPAHLFDANIFHPEKRTLLYSDAMLAPGFVGAPLIWAGVHPVAVHNLLLVAAFFLSALACYALCRELTGDAWAAVLGGVVFAFAPFRFGHIGHLELQWTAAMPLVLLVLHRASAGSRARVFASGAGAGALLALQGFSSLYYAVFFAIYLVVWSALVAIATAREHRRTFALVLATAAVVAGTLLAPYLAAYAGVRRTLGPRAASEIQQHSARPGDYLRVSNENETYKRTDPNDQDERSLFPGLLAVGLAGCGLLWARSGTRWTYAALTMLAVDLSLGSNGLTYPLLGGVLPILSSFRAPARFGMLVLLSLAVLSSAGLAALRQRVSSRAKGAMTCGLVALCIVEYWAAPIGTRREPLDPPAVYRWLAGQPGGVILELPVPQPSGLWMHESTYELMSTYHWNRLVNGYSGHAPVSYLETLETIHRGNAGEIARRLQMLGVDYLILHARLYGPAAFADALNFYAALPGAGRPQSFDDRDYPAVVIPFGEDRLRR